MTSHPGRLYAVAIAIFAFFLAWAAVSAKPWKSAAPSPQLQLIALRRQALTRETALVNQVLALRAKAATATPTPAASPAVRVVTLPPLTITRTS